jgi:hypothetical protein
MKLDADKIIERAGDIYKETLFQEFIAHAYNAGRIARGETTVEKEREDFECKQGLRSRQAKSVIRAIVEAINEGAK